MDLVPDLLDSFDFADVFKQNEDLAESFFTHIISGDYPRKKFLFSLLEKKVNRPEKVIFRKAVFLSLLWSSKSGLLWNFDDKKTMNVTITITFL